jgi:hypothetical protein
LSKPKLIKSCRAEEEDDMVEQLEKLTVTVKKWREGNGGGRSSSSSSSSRRKQ